MSQRWTSEVWSTDDGVLITCRPCMVCGHGSVIPVSTNQYRGYCAGLSVQVVFPDWTPAEREMLISGTHPECWELLFSDADEEDFCE